MSTASFNLSYSRCFTQRSLENQKFSVFYNVSSCQPTHFHLKSKNMVSFNISMRVNSTSSFKELLLDQETQEEKLLTIYVEAGKLRNAVSKVLGGLSRKAAPSILDHVLLKTKAADGNAFLQVTTTDGVVALKSVIGLQNCESPGEAAVKGKLFFDFLSQVQEQSILKVCSMKEGGVTITLDDSVTAVLKGQSALDFPELPQMRPSVKILFERGHLREAISRTRFAAPKDDESQQNLNSVFLSISNGMIRTVATDGRLFSSVTVLPQEILPADFTGSFLLPIKAVDEVCKYLGGNVRASSKKAKEALAEADKSTVTLLLQEERMAVLLEDGSMIGSQLLVGDYPDLLPLLQQEPQFTVLLDRSELLAHLKKVLLFAGRDKAEPAAVSLRFTQDSVVLSTSTHNFGKYTGEIEIEYSGSNANISFNPFLLVDIVNNLQEDKVNLGITHGGGGGATIIKEDKAAYVLGALWDSNTE